MAQISDLPDELLDEIFSFLPPRGFLSLCQTSKAFYGYRQDPTYWRTLTSATFRLPISPLLKADGARWYWLYKRLKTQTHLYTWGQGVQGNLGLGVPRVPARFFRGNRMGPPIRHAAPVYPRTNSTWPTDTHVPDEIKVIADLQCGGWSTSILSSEGRLYVVGIIDSMDGRYVGEPAERFEQLHYLTESTSAIKQFSSGRRHILALTDDLEIVSWDRTNANGLKVYPRTGISFGGKATRVVAGWGESSAYIPEIGIVYWVPVTNNQQDNMLDGVNVLEKVIPGTARSALSTREAQQPIDIVAHVVLEGYIVWLASDSRLFACDIHTNTPDQAEPTFPAFEVPGYASNARKLQDLQGQFNKFVVFTDTGEVLAGNTDFLRRCAEASREDPPNIDRQAAFRPTDVPALQHTQVIKVAFGDHHSHALHANGTITSYGNDCQSCGCLGLGSVDTGARFRGLRRPNGVHFRPDSKLIPQAERKGRQVWFEPEKRDWLQWLEEMVQTGKLTNENDITADAAREMTNLWSVEDKQLGFSDWIEQEGRHWNEGPLHSTSNPNLQDLSISSSKPSDDFHLDPYFATAIAAAGWHSGALIVVDEELAQQVRKKWITTFALDELDEEERQRLKSMPGHFESGPSEPEEIYTWKIEGFPKVRLADGYEMPGQGDVRPWRE